MRKGMLVRVVVSVLVIATAVLLLWPRVDQSASRVSMCVTGVGLLIAWYSILDLREARKEQWWPHTVDRLMRATFTAVTLVFVVDLGVRPPPEDRPAPPAQPPVVLYFADEVMALLSEGRWDREALQRVVDRHFAKLAGQGSGGRIYLSPEPNHRLVLGVRSPGRIAVETP